MRLFPNGLPSRPERLLHRRSQGDRRLSGQMSGPDFASRMGHELIDRALETARHPFAGQPVKAHPDTRKILHHRYFIYYDINSREGRIEILRIWHSARDPKTLRMR